MGVKFGWKSDGNAGNSHVTMSSDIPPSQSAAQGHFMVGATHKSKPMRSRGKDSWPRRHSLNRLSQAPNNKLSPTEAGQHLVLYSHIQLHVYKYTREHNQLIMTTSETNEYTSLYKYKSLTLYFRKGDVWCVWEMSGDKDGLLYWPKFFLGHSSTSFASWLGLLNRESLGAQSPLSAAGSHFGILSPTESNRQGTWLHYFLKLTCFRCSSAYIHRCISWLAAGSRVNI